MRFFRAPVWSFSRGRGMQEAENTVAESLVRRCSMRKRTVARSIGRVSTRFGEGGEQLDRRRAREAQIRCMRQPWAQTGRFFLRIKLVSGHGLFFSYEGPQGVSNGLDHWGVFRDEQG